MRFSTSIRLAWLLSLASLACSESVFAQRLSLADVPTSEFAQPSAYSSEFADGPNAQPNGPVGIVPPLVPSDRLARADNYGSTDGFFNQPSISNQLNEPSGQEGGCDASPNRGLVAFVSYDSWKGRPDGGWQNNGIASGLNFGTRLGQFTDWTGVGFQIGGSAAAYDWSGTDFRLRNNNQAEPQGFITYGLFRRANENSKWSGAIVQDWMLNANFSEFGQNPTLSQWRGQWGYVLSPRNEIGIWGGVRGHEDSRVTDPIFGTVSWRAVNQLSFFLHHKWAPGGADTSLWVGLPENHRLGENGSLGDYLIGLSATVPLSDLVGLYTMINYMHPSAAGGPAGFDEEAWNFTVGLTFYPGRNARSNTVAGQCWMPMMPVANNGLFMVDSNKAY